MGNTAPVHPDPEPRGIHQGRAILRPDAGSRRDPLDGHQGSIHERVESGMEGARAAKATDRGAIAERIAHRLGRLTLQPLFYVRDFLDQLIHCGELCRSSINDDNATMEPGQLEDLRVGEPAATLISWISVRDDSGATAPAAKRPVGDAKHCADIKKYMHSSPKKIAALSGTCPVSCYIIHI